MNPKLPKLVQQYKGQAMSMSLYSGMVLVRYMIPLMEGSSSKGGVFAEGTAATFAQAESLALAQLEAMQALISSPALPSSKDNKKRGK